MTRNNYKLLLLINITKGYAVAQLVETLLYKLEGHRFDCQLGHWDLSLSESSCLHHSLWIDSDSNGNEYQGCCLEVKAGQCIGPMTFPPSCASCLEIRGASFSWSRMDLSGPV